MPTARTGLIPGLSWNTLAADAPGTTWSLPPWALLLLVAGGVALLLLLVVKVKLHAFLALLLVSIGVAAAAGIRLSDLPGVLEQGMGDSLGEIAIIVALGAMLGRVMQESGAVEVLSGRLLAAVGEKRAPLAVGLTALLVGVPVFFDVGFILLMPLIYAVAQRSGRSVISVALPAVGGLAIMHAVLPPHPGPVAAAGLLGASLGWVTVMGLVCGLPAWFVGSYLFGVKVGDRLHVPVPALATGTTASSDANDGTGTADASGTADATGRADAAGSTGAPGTPARPVRGPGPNHRPRWVSPSA
ncbi:GntP family permease [Streptomyces sp. PU-14G]|uniref:GntP family permease n=1 Tax=Streptomyces sp. PU-14G TaxID=2800808 RepID=UPI0034DFE2C4